VPHENTTVGGQKVVAMTNASIEHLGKSIETPLADPKPVCWVHRV